MEKQNIEINLAPGQTALQITHIDGGTRLDEVQLKKIVEITNIYGPAEYIMKHYGQHIATDEVDGQKVYYPTAPLKPGIITFIRDFVNRKLAIRFDELPQHPVDGVDIRGELQVNPELTGWGLNSGDFMSTKQAVEFVRKRAHHFGSIADAQALISLFRNFEVTFETARKKADDARGNVEDALKESIRFKSGELPKDLFITLPLFKGTPAKTLRLDIELERKGNEAGLAFYCMELEDVLRKDAITIMDEQLKPFAGLFVVLEKQ